MKERREALLKDPSLGDEERERLLRELAEAEEQLQDKMDAARNRAKAKVAAKLKAKRSRLLAKAIAKTEAAEEGEDAPGAGGKEDKDGVGAGEDEGGDEVAEEKLQGAVDEEEADEKAAEDAVTEDDSWMDALLKTSPIFKAVRQMERAAKKSKGGFKDPGHRQNPDAGRFLEERDAQFRTEGKLKAVDVGALSPRQLQNYQLGLLMAGMAAEENALPTVRLLLADQLPHNDYEHNAFRHSTHFDPKSRTLFLRRERAENAADFLLCLLHAMSHAQVGDMRDDEDPMFRAVFFKVSAFEKCASAPQTG